MDAKELLICARELIAAPGGFTQGAFARDVEGNIVQALDPAAVCFCSYGALEKGQPNRTARQPAINALAAVVDNHTIAFFNDTHTQAEVVAAFDKAIASLEPTE